MQNYFPCYVRKQSNMTNGCPTLKELLKALHVK